MRLIDHFIADGAGGNAAARTGDVFDPNSGQVQACVSLGMRTDLDRVIAPVQAATIDVPSAQGTVVEAVAWAKGLPAPRWYRGNDIELLDGWFDARVLKGSPVR